MKTLVAAASVVVAVVLFGFSRKQPPASPPPPPGGEGAPLALAGLTPPALAVANITQQQVVDASPALQAHIDALQAARIQLSNAINELSSAVSTARADPLNTSSAEIVATARATVASRRASVVSAESTLAQAMASAFGAEQTATLRRVAVMAQRRLPLSFAVVNMDAATLVRVGRGARLAESYVQGVDPDTGEPPAPDSPAAFFIQIRNRSDVLAADTRLAAARPAPAPSDPPR